jgi:predicted MFS family arabinose efflux permease
MTFFLTIIPGAIVAGLILNILKEPVMTGIKGTRAKEGKPSFKESLVIYKDRNIRTSMVFGAFILIWNIGTLTFAPVYLVTVKGFSPENMSYVMAAAGIGAVVWGMLVPSMSDFFGRKPAVIIFTLLSAISPIGLLMASSPAMISILVFVGWGGSGVFALHQGAIIGESIDTKYASTAMASVQMSGEIGGAVIGVAIAGALADTYGLHSALIFTACSAAVAGLVAFAYYETAPLVLEKREETKNSRRIALK